MSWLFPHSRAPHASAASSSKKEVAHESAQKPAQAGAHAQPMQMSAQHIEKPGHESELDLQPQFMAPDYEGSGKLKDGIGRAVAVLYAREGADVAIVDLNEHDDAQETQARIEAEGGRCVLIASDVKDAEFGRKSQMKRAAQPEELSPASCCR